MTNAPVEIEGVPAKKCIGYNVYDDHGDEATVVGVNGQFVKIVYIENGFNTMKHHKDLGLV